MDLSSREVARQIYAHADMAQVERIQVAIQAILMSEQFTEATGATIVSMLVGWYVASLSPELRAQFEQCIEVNLEIVAERF